MSLHIKQRASEARRRGAGGVTQLELTLRKVTLGLPELKGVWMAFLQVHRPWSLVQWMAGFDGGEGSWLGQVRLSQELDSELGPCSL